MTTKAFDTNRNIRQQREKLAAGLDAMGKHLGQLARKKKQLAADIAQLVHKSMIESLKKSYDHLLEAVGQAEKAFAEFHNLLANASANPVDMAKKTEITDAFFIASISRAARPGDNLKSWLEWASGVTVPGNRFHKYNSKSGESGFKKGGLFHGRNAHFQNS